MAIQQRTYSWNDDHTDLVRLAANRGGREVIQRFIDEQRQEGAFQETLGIQVTGVSDGQGEARCQLAPFHGGWLGLIPCSLLSAIGMSAALSAGISRLGPTESIRARSTSLEFIEQPRRLNDELRAFAVVRSEDRERMNVDFTVRASDGAEIATGSVTFDLFLLSSP